MAVDVKKNAAHLSIVFDNGVDEHGKAKKRTKTYSSVKSSAENEQVYAVAKAICALQADTALEILRKDESELTEA